MNGMKFLAFILASLVTAGLSAGAAFAFFDVETRKGLAKAAIGGFVAMFIYLLFFAA